MSKPPEWQTWRHMIERCENRKHRYYHKYGGQGINVYQLWRESFDAFYSYMGSKPNKTFTLERVDNSKGYIPGNVVWASKAQQSANRGIQVNNKVGYKGVWCPKPQYLRGTKKYRAQIGYNRKTIFLGLYHTAEEAALAYDVAAIQLYGDIPLNIL